MRPENGSFLKLLRKQFWCNQIGQQQHNHGDQEDLSYSSLMLAMLPGVHVCANRKSQEEPLRSLPLLVEVLTRLRRTGVPSKENLLPFEMGTKPCIGMSLVFHFSCCSIIRISNALK